MRVVYHVIEGKVIVKEKKMCTLPPTIRVEGTFPKRGLSLRSPRENNARPTSVKQPSKKPSLVNAENLAEAQEGCVCRPKARPTQSETSFAKRALAEGKHCLRFCDRIGLSHCL